MAKADSKDRTVLVPVAEFDPSKSEVFPSISQLHFRSIALSTVSDSQTLIYVGSEDGKVVLLSLNPSLPGSATSVLDSEFNPNNSHDSLCHNIAVLKSVKVSDFSVDSIHVLVEIGRVLGLSDSVMFSFDLLLSEPVRRLNFLRGTSVVARRLLCPNSGSSNLFEDGVSRSELENDSHLKDSSIQRPGQSLLKKLTGGARVNGVKSRVPELQSVENHVTGASNPHLAVVIGKKLILIEFRLPGRTNQDMDFVGRFYDLDSFLVAILKEIQGFDGITTMVWFDNSIVVGTANGYTLFSSTTGQSILIFSLPDSSCPPRLKSLWRHGEALLVVDNVGIVVNTQGQPVGGSLLFRHAPDSIGETSGHVIIARDGKLDVYHRKTGFRVQSISFVGQGVDPSILASNEGGNGELIVVSMASKVICFRMLSAEEQIKDLLRKRNLKEAISLVEELECEGVMTKETISFVHAQVGFLLLFELHFEDAVNHFLQSEAMQPSEIFPFIMRDPNRWSNLVPRTRYWGLHPPPVPLEDVVDNGLMAIQRGIFLRKAGVDTGAEDGFLLSPPSRADLLESAIHNIIRYLQVSRDKELSPSVREGVDTLLMYLYRALNLVGDMEQLASSQNSCVVEELETLLEDSGHLRTLAFLYASKGMSSKALDIWRLLARNHSAGLRRDVAVGQDPHGNFAKIISDQKTVAIEASCLLEESSDQNMVLQHLRWIADVDEELAVRVLTSEKRANQLSPEEVLATIDSKRVEIHQRYLQWLVEDQDSDDTQFHTLYALSLAKSAIESVEMESTYQNPKAVVLETMNISDVDSSTLLKHSVRERLQSFLQSSDLYDPEAVLELIEESELWLEKAILYRKLGQESLVLQILALKLEDSEAAERYCAEIGRPDAYMQLLDMYLDPQDGKEPMFKAAVCLLHNHGESLDPLLVLETLSPDMPLQLASDTLLRMLRARVHHHRQGQIVRNLSRAINLDARLARLEERSRHVQINDESLCDSCHSRLGTKLFAMYPDDSIVCYKVNRRLLLAGTSSRIQYSSQVGLSTDKLEILAEECNRTVFTLDDLYNCPRDVVAHFPAAGFFPEDGDLLENKSNGHCILLGRM